MVWPIWTVSLELGMELVMFSSDLILTLRQAGNCGSHRPTV
jgi:hypothetical protein